jgi:DNA/RNA-binding domain of Phe-tRNA-synthetase-like protein
VADPAFSIEPDVFERLPGMRVVVTVADGLEASSAGTAIDRLLEEAWTAAGALRDRYPNAQSHPNVAAWRERFKAMGVRSHDFPTSVEALLRRAMRGGSPPRINPLVDAYNAISLRHVVPAGAFDLDALGEGLELRLTVDGDTFVALDEDRAVPVPPGEVAYATGSTVLTRHIVWRQSREALISPGTRRAVVISEILGALPDAVVDVVRRDLEALLSDTFQADVRAEVLDATRPRTSLQVGESRRSASAEPPAQPRADPK